MMVELKIENLGIIENLKFRPGRGLNVITGETGSGKSLIIQALGIVLGDKAGTGYLRKGSNKAVIEATFDITRKESKKREIENFLSQHKIPSLNDVLILRREIIADGKPRAFINNVLVSLNVLKELGSKIVEIHGQHENQRLLDADYHLDFVDQLGGFESLRQHISQLYNRWMEGKKKLKTAFLLDNEIKYRKEFLEYAIKEIENFSPKENEYEELQNERSMILNSGKLFQDLNYIYSVLQEEEHSVISILQNIEKILEKHLTVYPEYNEFYTILQDSIFNLESFIDFIRERKSKMNFSSERLEDIEDRLDGYRKLFKKYGSSTQMILQKKQSFIDELNSIEMSDEEKELLKSQLQVIEQKLNELCEELSEKRKKIIPVLEEKLENELSQLGMKGAKIQISLTREILTDDEENKEIYKITEKGYDSIEFLFSANEGESILPLRKVASGGELSRIALAMKTILMDKNGPITAVFDEIDTGVGGETAFELGKKLKKISSEEQTIVITHLHQIASMSNRHFKIFKTVKNSRTYTQIERVIGESRLKELARMLGGSEPVIYEHARNILNRFQTSVEVH